MGSFLNCVLTYREGERVHFPPFLHIVILIEKELQEMLLKVYFIQLNDKYLGAWVKDSSTEESLP